MEFNANHLDNALNLFEAFVNQADTQRKSITYAIVAVMQTAILVAAQNEAGTLTTHNLIKVNREPVVSISDKGVLTTEKFYQFHELSDKELLAVATEVRLLSSRMEMQLIDEEKLKALRLQGQNITYLPGMAVFIVKDRDEWGAQGFRLERLAQDIHPGHKYGQTGSKKVEQILVVEKIGG